LAGVDPSQFHLELLPAGTRPHTVRSVIAAGKATKLETTATLAEAGITQGACIVAVLPVASTIPQEQSKTITICSFQEDEEYTEEDLTLHSPAELKDILFRVEAVGFVDVDDIAARPKILFRYDDLVSGKRYSLSGKFYSAKAGKKRWTQQADRQLELDATAALLRDMEEDFGPLTEFTGNRELTVGTEKQEFDGIVLSSSAVLFVEARHTASVGDHFPILEKEVSFIKKFLKATDIPAEFKAVGPNAKVIPFYAARCIDKKEQHIFTKLGYNVIIPNGTGLSVIRANQ
jgi:hypothetical protein